MSKFKAKAPSGAQLEILQVLLASEAPLSAPEVWTAVNEARPVSRATVSTQLDRLEKSRWISREGEGRSARYAAIRSAEEAKHDLAKTFLSRFFDSSVSNMVLSLVDDEVDEAELDRLRQIIDEAESRRKERKS